MSTSPIAETITPPRTRWGAIIWGLLFAAIAGGALWVVADADRRVALADGLVSLTPATTSTILVLAAGVLLLVSGAVGLIRRAQRSLATATPAPAPASAPEVVDPLAE